MEIQLQTDGQLHPPKNTPPKPKTEKKPPPPPPLQEPTLPWEELLLALVIFIVLKGDEKPDLPLLLALAYILFDSKFNLKSLL